MSEDQPTARLTFSQPLMVVAAVAAGIVVGAIFLLLSARTAGAATLPPLTSPISAATTTLGDVVSSAPSVVSTTVSLPDPLATTAASAGSSVSQLVNGGSSVVTSLAGPIGLSGAVAAPPISVLPVLTSPAPLVLGDVVNQGPQTTPTPNRSVSAPTLLGVVSRTGSADLFSPVTPTRTGPVGILRPLVPVPSPRRPSVPELPPVAAGASSAPGLHSGTLDTLPPAVVVLALLAAGGVCLELRRRPKFRYDLRFSPPG
jgi:hypothetical protein